MNLCCSWSQLEIGRTMPSVRRETAGIETWVKYASTMLSHSVNKMLKKPIFPDVQTICVYAIFGHVAEKLACLALSTWVYSVVATFLVLLPRQHKVHTCSGHKWLVGNLRLRRPHALHGRMGHLFALWPVSPHSSHIASVCASSTFGCRVS